MTGGELRAALRGLGLSQASFSILCRVNSRTVRRWVSNEIPVPGPVVALVRFAQAAKVAYGPAKFLELVLIVSR